MSLLIAGGSGFIGRSLTNFFRSAGSKVYVVTREPKNEDDISWMQLKANGLPENTKAVINLSGRSIAEFSPLYLINRYYQPYRKELFDSRLETTKAIVKAITESKTHPEIFINASAIGFYQPSFDESYTETSPYKDHDFITRLCRDWEAAAQIPNMPEVRTVQLRFGLVLGSGGGILQKMYWPFFLGFGGPIGSGSQWMSWIHMEDIIGLIKFTIDNKNVSSGPLNATSPNPVTNKQFATSLGRALFRPAIIPTTELPIKCVFGERASLFLDGQRVIPQKSLELGFNFKYPHLDEALKAVYG